MRLKTDILAAEIKNSHFDQNAALVSITLERKGDRKWACVHMFWWKVRFNVYV